MSSATDYRFLKACRGEQVDKTPVWFMRQAGRYMKEYRALKKKYSFLEMCQTPELATEVTLQPLKPLGVDAAIIFADILLPLEPMGTGLEFIKGDGPSIPRPVRTLKDVKNLRTVNSKEQLGYVGEAIKLVRQEIEGKIPLVGFAAAPFTLGSYMVEGGKSSEFKITKLLMYEEPDTWKLLMEKVSIVLIDYLKMQVAAGAQALQIFDSWIGCVTPEDYREYIMPYCQKVINELKDLDVPIINFSTGTSSMLDIVAQAGGDVMSFDWRINIDQARDIIGWNKPVQGNMDPVVLFAPIPVIKKRVHDILHRVGDKPGHIFNLGHGILQHTPVDHVKAVVDMVREYKYER